MQWVDVLTTANGSPSIPKWYTPHMHYTATDVALLWKGGIFQKDIFLALKKQCKTLKLLRLKLSVCTEHILLGTIFMTWSQYWRSDAQQKYVDYLFKTQLTVVDWHLLMIAEAFYFIFSMTANFNATCRNFCLQKSRSMLQTGLLSRWKICQMRSLRF